MLASDFPWLKKFRKTEIYITCGRNENDANNVRSTGKSILPWYKIKMSEHAESSTRKSVSKSNSLAAKKFSRSCGKRTNKSRTHDYLNEEYLSETV